MELLLPTLIGLAIGIAGIWWIINDESKDSEKRYRASKEASKEIARQQAEFYTLRRRHPDWSEERIYEEIDASVKARQADSAL